MIFFPDPLASVNKKRVFFFSLSLPSAARKPPRLPHATAGRVEKISIFF
jgi:hypothetical protein